MTTQLPRPIEPGEAWTGDRVRAERTDGTDLDIYEITVRNAWPAGVEGDHVYLSRDEYAFTLLARPAPTPAPAVGSRWEGDGHKYIVTEAHKLFCYAGGLMGVYFPTERIKEDALTPIPDHGDGCSEWLWDKETGMAWVAIPRHLSQGVTHQQVYGEKERGGYLVANSEDDREFAARLRPYSKRGQA